jgi:hypothetical protein
MPFEMEDFVAGDAASLQLHQVQWNGGDLAGGETDDDEAPGVEPD